MTLNARPGFYQDIAREQLWLLLILHRVIYGTMDLPKATFD